MYFNCILISIKLKVFSYGYCIDFFLGWFIEGVRIVFMGGNEIYCYIIYFISFVVMLVSGYFCYVLLFLKCIYIV